MFLDDVDLLATEAGPAAATTCASATRQLVQLLSNLVGMEVSQPKCQALASSGRTRRTLLSKLPLGFNLVRATKKLGIGFTLSTKRTAIGSAARGSTSKIRASRIAAIRRGAGRAQTAALLRAGLTPAVTFGVRVHGMATTRMQALRRQAARILYKPNKLRS